jgi:PAS domain S-box-containing protein
MGDAGKSQKSINEKNRGFSDQDTSNQNNGNIQLLKLALSAGQIGIWEWNLKLDKIFIDSKFKKILTTKGHKFSNYLDDWRQIVYSEDATRVVDEFKNLLLNRTQQFEIEFRLANSKIVLLKGSVINAAQVVGICLDISTLKKKNAWMEEQAKGYLATVENIPVGILSLDQDGVINSANQAFGDIFDIKINEIVDKLKISSLTPFKESGLDRYFNDLIDKGIAFDFESPLIKNYSGKQLYLHCKGITLSASGYIILFSDITNHKQLEEQYRQSQKLEAIGELAGGVAHDFNNILTVIQGASTLMLSSLDVSNPAYENARQINKAAERAESLTRQLLAFSRRQLMQPKVIDLNQLIRDMDSMLRRNSGEKNDLEIVINSERGNIKVDPGQIEQVIMNLLVNACDAIPDGGKITIETMNVILDENYLKKRPVVKTGSYVMLTISDSGIGMDKETMAHIFEPFFSTKEKGKASGMGLATVYGIVKQSDGYIWVYSEPGIGTTFKIYFPRVDEHIDAMEKTVITDQSMKGTETILVVEDEEQVRNLVSEMLRFNGYNVLEAANASNALSIFDKYSHSINLILTDIVMPQMNGTELIEKILTLYPNMKVLYMSGYTDNVLVGRGLLAEEKYFLQKPFSASTLIQKVRLVLDE